MIGPKCNIPRCPNNCDGKGLCLNGKCACWEGQVGYDCSIPLACAEPCTEACAVDTTGEKCKFCIGQCISYQGHPTSGSTIPSRTSSRRPARRRGIRSFSFSNWSSS